MPFNRRRNLSQEATEIPVVAVFAHEPVGGDAADRYAAQNESLRRRGGFTPGAGGGARGHCFQGEHLSIGLTGEDREMEVGRPSVSGFAHLCDSGVTHEDGGGGNVFVSHVGRDPAEKGGELVGTVHSSRRRMEDPSIDVAVQSRTIHVLSLLSRMLDRSATVPPGRVVSLSDPGEPQSRGRILRR